MKKNLGIIFIISGILAMIVAIIRVFGIVANIATESASVTIIGGADGPTSIFLAGKLDNSVGGIVFVGVVLLIIGIIILIKKKKSNP